MKVTTFLSVAFTALCAAAVAVFVALDFPAHRAVSLLHEASLLCAMGVLFFPKISVYAALLLALLQLGSSALFFVSVPIGHLSAHFLGLAPLGKAFFLYWAAATLVVVSIVVFIVCGALCLAAAELVDRCITANRQWSYKGRHVFITGGGTGLGAELARLFFEDGALVTIVSRNDAHLRTVAQAIRDSAVSSKGGMIQHFVCDVTDAASVAAAVDSATAAYDGMAPHVVVTCAGLSHPGRFTETPLDQFEREMRLNYIGTVAVLKETVPRMLQLDYAKRKGACRIVLVSSALGLIGSSGYSQYAPTKYAVRGLAESLDLELRPQGIDVSIFFPANMQTPSYDIECQSKPAEAALLDHTVKTVPPSEAAQLCYAQMNSGMSAMTNTRGVDLLRAAGLCTADSPTPVRDFLQTPVLWIGMRVQKLIWRAQIHSVLKKERAVNAK